MNGNSSSEGETRQSTILLESVQERSGMAGNVTTIQDHYNYVCKNRLFSMSTYCTMALCYWWNIPDHLTNEKKDTVPINEPNWITLPIFSIILSIDFWRRSTSFVLDIIFSLISVIQHDLQQDIHPTPITLQATMTNPAKPNESEDPQGCGEHNAITRMYKLHPCHISAEKLIIQSLTKKSWKNDGAAAMMGERQLEIVFDATYAVLPYCTYTCYNQLFVWTEGLWMECSRIFHSENE